MVRILTEEFPEEQLITHKSPLLGGEPFVLIEGDPSKTEFLSDEDKILALAVTVGGGFTEKNLPRLLRGLADLLDVQARRASSDRC